MACAELVTLGVKAIVMRMIAVSLWKRPLLPEQIIIAPIVTQPSHDEPLIENPAEPDRRRKEQTERQPAV